MFTEILAYLLEDCRLEVMQRLVEKIIELLGLKLAPARAKAK